MANHPNRHLTALPTITADPTLPRHISTVPTGSDWHHETFDPDGLCHCTPQPEPSAIGECPKCHRLNAQHAQNRRDLAAIVTDLQRAAAIDTAVRLLGIARHPSTPPALFIELGRDMETALTDIEGITP